MPEKLTAIRASWSDVAPYAAVATKEHVNVTNVKNCAWFMTVDSKGRVTAFAGVAPVSKDRARIRAVWVRPDFRGRGLGDDVSLSCLAYAKGYGFREVEILSWDPRWALRNGFVERNKTQHGATRLVYTFGA